MEDGYMKIIVANYRYFVAGGPEKYMFKFIEAAQRRGVEIIPFSVLNDRNVPSKYSNYFAKPRTKELMFSDVKWTVNNYWGMARATIWNYEAGKKLKKLIRATKPDAIYILHEINHLSPSIIRIAHKENIRIIHRISDFFMFCAKYDFLYGDEICELCIQGDYMNAIVKKCVKGSLVGTCLRVFAMQLYKKNRVFEDVDVYISTCEFSKNKLIEGGIPKEKVVCIPTFIDAREIQPTYEDDKYFLFLGRMVHQKGVIYAIEAMSYVKDNAYRLKITGEPGDSKDDEYIKNYIYQNKLEEKIVFTGFIYGEQLNDLIEKATCVLCPAIWYENMPNSVIEAYAHGKSVIASNIGSLAEIVDDGETGFLFKPKDALDLYQKMQKYIDTPELVEQMGKKARLKCERDYSEEEHMSKLLKLFS